MTSSIDFLPKFGIAASSPSDFETRSPTVWMPARLRQLYERTPSSSSSMRMSSIGPPPGRPPRAAGGTAPGRREGTRARLARAVVERGDAAAGAGAQLLDAVLVGEDRQRG